jgi:NAD-dependent deacetylase
MKASYSGQGIKEGIETLALFMKEATNTVVLTGAGMDTESNIPDFRSKSGWWRKMDPSTVASVTTLQQNYPLFHEFYSMRIKMLAGVKPHKGHHVLADLERKGLIKSIATQNVSGLHRQAESKSVYELHGNIKTIRCNQCNSSAELQDFLDRRNCSACGQNLLRPNVVLFGEFLPKDAWGSAERDIRQSDLLVVIGTSLKVSPVNQLPMLAPGKVVLINNEDTSSACKFDLKIIGKAKEVLEELSLSLT